MMNLACFGSAQIKVSAYMMERVSRALIKHRIWWVILSEVYFKIVKETSGLAQQAGAWSNMTQKTSQPMILLGDWRVCKFAILLRINQEIFGLQLTEE